MNVKVSIVISESTLDRAEKMVRSGAYNSLSEVFEMGVESIAVSQQDEPTQEQLSSVASMAGELRRRMASPPDQWLDEDAFDTEIDRLLAYADEQIKAGR